MQIDTSAAVSVTNSLGVASTTMTLDPEGMAHLTQVLTNLYADKHLAVLREYSTNALDSHVAAGTTAPVEVTLPTALNPTLVITDHGVGLSRDEIVNVYARYGASTKRGTNTQIGSFGLGAKSAFTIGGQFVVTATKDGRRTVAVFALDNHGVGTVNILAETETVDANGVTVSIAVGDHRQMQDAAEKFFRSWRPGTVLVDGSEPESLYTDGMWLGNDVLHTRRGGITVVMGSVAYPLPASAVHAVRERAGGTWHVHDGRPGLTVFLPIGSVDITPSREAVRDTSRSIDTVAAALRNLPERFEREAHRRTAAATCAAMAVLSTIPLRRAAEWTGVHGLSTAQWRGRPISDLGPAELGSHATFYGKTSRGALSTNTLDKLSVATLDQVTVLVGVPKGRSARRHAKAWVADNRVRLLVQFGDGHDLSGRVDWLTWGDDSPLDTVRFEDIELPSEPDRPRTQTSYDVQLVGGNGQATMTADQVNSAEHPLAYTDDHLPTYAIRSIEFRRALDGYLVIHLRSGQSTAALRRRVPRAVRADDLSRRWVDDRFAALGSLDDLVAAMREHNAVKAAISALGKSRADRITHPTYHRAVTAAASFTSLDPETRELIQRHAGRVPHRGLPALHRDLPLLVRAANFQYDENALDHLVLYANAIAPNPFGAARPGRT
ncbi:ATP-binding protein [Nakamurella multipartita]|uniref:ATP-binding region ATPase domain protein n=1 Tax=Nakamurella multipartita (strain ATCC 700099 / DSM 44233 / CIP 104796 / JCM 9543 / NBRC 105858 / Y-104) TaxID=479431 RepID=C8X8F9_NAKMY|nr:ATP-binding protein [Nakamurella multipartita]ACV79014.1 hypothetical protein Namu_2668 [Nakamurella multipartita DSM 44233]